MNASEITPLAKQIPEWVVIDERRLERDYGFVDFKNALSFTVAVGEVAEQESHHPDIHLSWGHVSLELWTHKIDGLTESDFILASKIEAIWMGFPGRKIR